MKRHLLNSASWEAIDRAHQVREPEPAGELVVTGMREAGGAAAAQVNGRWFFDLPAGYGKTVLPTP